MFFNIQVRVRVNYKTTPQRSDLSGCFLKGENVVVMDTRAPIALVEVNKMDVRSLTCAMETWLQYVCVLLKMFWRSAQCLCKWDSFPLLKFLRFTNHRGSSEFELVEKSII